MLGNDSDKMSLVKKDLTEIKYADGDFAPSPGGWCSWCCWCCCSLNWGAFF